MLRPGLHTKSCAEVTVEEAVKDLVEISEWHAHDWNRAALIDMQDEAPADMTA